MSEISIKAKKRILSTKGAVNKLRRNGEVPGIFYTKGTEPIAISVPELSLHPIVYTAETHIINLEVDDNEVRKSILKNIQFDPVTDKVIHFDFLGISLDQEIDIEVPIALTGQAKGIKEGGIIQQSMHKLQVSCLPGDIPEHISIDVTNLGLGDAVHVKDLAIEKVKIRHNEEVIIVAVVMPRAQVETPAAGTEVLAEEKMEPEVISKGKQTEEEE
ncbi:MAG TPA: 50S ribosomal protein L25 [Melioribacteraceae bacterium]|nr:50S ribosomal protein L25 [Melioribacteraceae bacterium]